MCTEATKLNTWSARAIKNIKHVIKNASKIYFTILFQQNHSNYGEMTFIKSGDSDKHQRSVSSVLLKIKECCKSVDFTNGMCLFL